MECGSRPVAACRRKTAATRCGIVKLRAAFDSGMTLQPVAHVPAIRSGTIRLLWLLLLAAALAACRSGGGARADGLEPCRLPGVEREILCGTVAMPEDPDAPAGRSIDIRYAVVPAVARNKQPDPLFVFAGGPGQAASDIIAHTMPVLAQLNARRDIVYVDQRGTGRSNALTCPEDAAGRPDFAATFDPSRQLARLHDCLKTLPGDTSQYATWIAMRDIDAVRRQLGAERINLLGGSYGTRAALEYLRQFPQHARSVVLDGVAPPDMALPAAFAVDSDASLTALARACAADSRCAARFPDAAAQVDALLARAVTGFDVMLTDPLSGAAQRVRIDQRVMAVLLRTPLYLPSLAAVLPQALLQAAAGDFQALAALSLAVADRTGKGLAAGMHFAVICAEDMPRIGAAQRSEAAATRFGTVFIDQYTEACAPVATRTVPDAFYDVPRSDVPVLVLSGGLDPATPPRHGAAVAERLGNARHIVAPALGHGILRQGCAPRLITRFVRDGDHRKLDDGCLRQIPVPSFFEPVEPFAAAAAKPPAIRR